METKTAKPEEMRGMYGWVEWVIAGEEWRARRRFSMVFVTRHNVQRRVAPVNAQSERKQTENISCVGVIGKYILGGPNDGIVGYGGPIRAVEARFGGGGGEDRGSTHRRGRRNSHHDPTRMRHRAAFHG